MIDVGVVIVSIGVLIFAAHFFAWVFSHTKIPDALLLIMVGILIGPVLGLLDPSFFGEAGELVVVLVLVILLFQGGIGLKWKTLRKAWRGTILLSIASFTVTVTLVGLVMWLAFDFEPILAFMLGAIVGGTSSAVVIPLVRQLNLGDAARAELLLESVFSDTLAIVVTIALLEAYQSGGFSVVGITFDVVYSLVGAGLIGVLVALVWSRLLSAVRHMKNSIFTTPALVFVLFGVAEQLGLSGPIAALAFGIMMGNVSQVNNRVLQKQPFYSYIFRLTPLSRREKLFFREVVFLMQTFFFVFVGLSMRFDRINPLIIGLALVTLMALLRPVVVRFVMPKSLSVHDATVMATMVPKGLAAAVLASLPLQQGLALGAAIQEITSAIILFSVIVTSWLIYSVHRTTVRKAYGIFFKSFSPSIRPDDGSNSHNTSDSQPVSIV